MKKILMIRKRIKGKEFRAVDLTAAKNVGANLRVRPARGLSVRETTRIHALTGVPWEQVCREVEKR